MASPTPGNANPGNVNFALPSLRDTVAQNYSGASQAIANQIAAAQDRYGQNKADITNILGNLSTIRSSDKAKIAQQFTSAIQASQDRANAMNAQAQQQLVAGQQGAQIAGAELGGGPQGTPTDSLTSQAVAQGIADQNANQGVWGNLMQGMNMQQQGNVDTSVQGYNLQQAAALDALRKNYNDTMLGLGNQQLSLQDQIAQGVAGINANQAEMQQENYLQQLKNQGLTNVARIRAAGQIAAKKVGKSGGGSSGTSSTSSASTYTKDAVGFAKRASDAGLNYPQLSQSVSSAFGKVRSVNDAKAAASQTETGSAVRATKPSAADVLAAWKSMNRKLPAYSLYLPYVEQYINMNY